MVVVVVTSSVVVVPGVRSIHIDWSVANSTQSNPGQHVPTGEPLTIHISPSIKQPPVVVVTGGSVVVEPGSHEMNSNPVNPPVFNAEQSSPTYNS